MYYCKQPQGNTCQEWVSVEPPLSESLAISKEQAHELTFAILSLFLLCFVCGLIGRFLLKEIV